MILRVMSVSFLVSGALSCFGGGGYGDDENETANDTSSSKEKDELSKMFDQLNRLKTNYNNSQLKNWKDHLDDYYDDGNEDSDKVKIIQNSKDPLERNILSGFRNWTPSPDMRQKWQGWLDEHNRQNNRTNIDFADPNNPHEFDHERGPGSGFPQDWAGLGAGHEGVAPPPWAYVPRLTGKPMRCSLPLKIGKPCPDQGSSSSTRYAYNPFLDKCVEFKYNGCNGNRNNFATKLSCEQICVVPIPFGGCDRESGIKIDDLVNDLD